MLRWTPEQLRAHQERIGRAPVSQQTKRTKYHNVRTVADGIKFDSKAEADRWLVLRELERVGAISDLQRQVRFDLTVHGPHGAWRCKYIADFCYTEAGRRAVEDVKGFKTPVYRIKRGLMAALHGIEIKEVIRK